jgi:hypothetical protein
MINDKLRTPAGAASLTKLVGDAAGSLANALLSQRIVF